MRRRIAAIIAIILLSVVSGVLAFTSLGRPADTCPPVLLGSGYPTNGKSPFAITSTAGKPVSHTGSGTVSWCLYGSFNLLEKSYLTNRLLTEVAVSGDGAFVAAVGFQIAPGPNEIYENGAVYLFDRAGAMKWNMSGSQPISSAHINSNGSIIVVNDPELLYLNNQGNLLWNYSQYESTAVVLLNDGANVLAGITEYPSPQHPSYEASLTMFDSRGRVVWSVTMPDQIFDSTRSLAVSGTRIAAGLTVTGYNGTMYCYNLQGGLSWSRPVDSAIGQVEFENNGSAIYVETNWGHILFDLAGNVIENQTAPHQIMT